MKKFLAMLLLVAIVASCTVALAGNVKFNKSAYVYEKAGSKKTKTIIKKTAVLEKLATKGKWTQVKYGNKTGWVKSIYVTDSSDKVQPKYSAGGRGKSTPTGEITSAKGTYVAAGKVSLRKGPALCYGFIRSVPKGTELTYTATAKDSRGVNWYKVKYKRKEGWVSGVYNKKEPAANREEPTEPANEEYYDGDWEFN